MSPDIAGIYSHALHKHLYHTDAHGGVWIEKASLDWSRTPVKREEGWVDVEATAWLEATEMGSGQYAAK